MERPLDQIFWVKSGQKGPDLESGHFTTVKSWKFWKLLKINFFWSKWLENRSKYSSASKFLDKTFKLAKKIPFLQLFGQFSQFWPYLVMAKSTCPRSGEIQIFLLIHKIYVRKSAWEPSVSLQMGKNFEPEWSEFFKNFWPEKFGHFCTGKVQKRIVSAS